MASNLQTNITRTAGNAVAETQGFFDSLTAAFRNGPSSAFRFLFQTRQGLLFTLGGTAAVLAVFGVISRRNRILGRSLTRQESFEGNSTSTPSTVGSTSTTTRDDQADIKALLTQLNSSDPRQIGLALGNLVQLSTEKRHNPELIKPLLSVLDTLTIRHTSSLSSSASSSSSIQTLNDHTDLLNLVKTLNNIASHNGRLKQKIADGAPNFIRIIQAGNPVRNEPERENINKILDNCFRVLMHLSVDTATEVKIGSIDGIPPVLQIMEDPTTKPSVSLQACRLLINLSFAEENRRIIISNRGVEIITALLHQHILNWSTVDNADDKLVYEEYVSKLIRAVGLLSKWQGLTPEVYKDLISSQLSRAVGDLLEHKSSEDKDAGNIVTATAAIINRGKDLGGVSGEDYGRFLKALRDRGVVNNLEKFRSERNKTQIDAIRLAINDDAST